MTGIEIIGLIASILSIIAAISSFYSAYESKSAKDKIISKLKIVNYSEFNGSTKDLLNTIRKFANKNALPRGVNLIDTSDKLNKFYERLNKVKHEFDKSSEIDSYLESFKKRLSELSKIDHKTNTKNYLDKMTEIYFNILELDAYINKQKKQILEE